MGAQPRGVPVGAGLVGECGDGPFDTCREPPRILALVGPQGAAERDARGGSGWPFLALAHYPARSFEVHRYDRHAAPQREIGGTALERLAPPVGGTAALGVDEQVPAIIDER